MRRSFAPLLILLTSAPAPALAQSVEPLSGHEAPLLSGYGQPGAAEQGLFGGTLLPGGGGRSGQGGGPGAAPAIGDPGASARPAVAAALDRAAGQRPAGVTTAGSPGGTLAAAPQGERAGATSPRRDRAPATPGAAAATPAAPLELSGAPAAEAGLPLTTGALLLFAGAAAALLGTALITRRRTAA